MSSSISVLKSDRDLIKLARDVFSNHGFSVELVTDGVDLLLAENHYFVIGVVATNTTQKLMEAESAAFQLLQQRMAASPVGSKKWDAYLVLLTQEPSGEEDGTTRGLFAINHDTSHMRRIAHTGVAANFDAVSRALSSFLRPVNTIGDAATDNALDSLKDALVAQGIDPDLAARALTVFEQGGVLDDVL